MTKNAAMLRRLRDEARKRGDCGVCRARPAKPGRLTCQDCLDRAYAVKAKKYERNPSIGLCVLCNRKAAPGVKECEYHREMGREKCRHEYHAVKKRGVCVSCRRRMAAGKIMCSSCRAKHSALVSAAYSARIAAGRCAARANCPNPIDPASSTMCREHLDRQASYSAAHTARRKRAA